MSYAENVILANQLNEVIKGKKIVNVIANQNPHKYAWFSLDPVHRATPTEISWEYAKRYGEYLTGETVKGARVGLDEWGCPDFIYAGDRALLFGDTGNVSYHTAEDKSRPKKHQLFLEFDDGSALVFVITFGGGLFLYPVDEDGKLKHVNNSFPLMLSDEFTPAFFLDFIAKEAGKKTVKNFLVTESRIPGFSNDILHEVLWEAKINPKSKMNLLSREEYISLYNAIRTVLSAVVEAGGKDTDIDIFGNYGGFVTRASKNTAGKPCHRCGDIIVKENNYVGSPIYYCPGCQPVVK